MTVLRQASFPPPGHTVPKMRRTRISYYELFVCNCHTAHKDDTRVTTQVINPSNQTSSLRMYLARDLYFHFIWFCKLNPDLMSVRQGNTIELYFQLFQILIFGYLSLDSCFQCSS